MGGARRAEGSEEDEAGVGGVVVELGADGEESTVGRVELGERLELEAIGPSVEVLEALEGDRRGDWDQRGAFPAQRHELGGLGARRGRPVAAASAAAPRLLMMVSLAHPHLRMSGDTDGDVAAERSKL